MVAEYHCTGKRQYRSQSIFRARLISSFSTCGIIGVEECVHFVESVHELLKEIEERRKDGATGLQALHERTKQQSDTVCILGIKRSGNWV